MLIAAVGCADRINPFLPIASSPQPAPIPVSGLASAYVASSGAGTVSSFQVSSAGLWTPTKPASVPVGSVPEALVVDASGRFVYVANDRDDTVSQFVIDSTTGLLHPNSPVTVPTGIAPQAMTTDATGRFVYVPNSGDATVSTYSINPSTGVLDLVNTVSSSGQVCGGIGIHPNGRFVYAGCSSGSVDAFASDASTGALTEIGKFTVQAGAGRVFSPVVEPTGHYLYVPLESVNMILVFSIDQSTGLLTPAATPSVSVGNAPSWIAVDPAGKYLYVINRGDASISEFSIGVGGALTPLSTPVLNDGGVPWQMLVDPSGQLAYVSNESKAVVEIYRIDASGELVYYSSAPAGAQAGGIGIARAR